MSDRYPGGFLQVVPPELDPALGNAAPGMWTLEQYLKYQKAGTWPAYDQYFNQTVLSLHGNGVNGAQNNTFLDSSTNNFTITRNGNATQGTFSPFSAPDGRWSNYFDGTGDAFRASASSLSMSSFTIEGWVNYSSDTGVRTFFDFANALNGYSVLALYSSTSGTFVVQFFSGNSSLNLIGTISISSWSTYFNQWTHLAITYDGSTYRVFVNGVLGGSLSSATAPISVNHITIGGRAETTPSQNLAGYISNFRYVTGAALYTSDFTPSTTPLTTAGSGTTQLIFAQSNRFVDTEGNYTFTLFGNPKVTPFSPFAPTAAYSTSVNGGSGYFDGSADFLVVPYDSSFLMGTTADFLMEVWVYPNPEAADSDVIMASYPSGVLGNWLLRLAGGLKVELYQYPTWGSGELRTTTSLQKNAWNLVSLSRESGTFRLFMNGVQEDTSTTSVNLGRTSTNITIARSESNSTTMFPGYISNCRFVNGSAIRTANFDLPTAPFEDVTNTVFLLKTDNAGIFDQTGKNNLETTGNCQIDTTTKVFGTGSVECDGSGDFLIAPDTLLSNFGSGDFTIEFWLYLNTTANTQNLIDNRPPSTQGVYITIYTASARIYFYTSSANRITSDIITTGTWYHVALCRSGTSTKLFIDGTQSGSTYTDSNSYLASRTIFGGGYSNSSSIANPLNGLIDDLRITRGVARYTSNFTPQTSQWQDR